MSSNSRVAVITGAGQGIGRAITLRLVDDGLDITVNDLMASKGSLDTLVKEIEAKGRKALAITGDVSSQADVQKLVDATVQEFGGLDVMVANAGINRVACLMDTSLNMWDNTFAINARGTFLCYQVAATQLIKQGRGGRLIGACSAGGKQGGRNNGAYSATKFAIRGLTQAAALELGQYGITVITYAPGAIDTELLARSDRDYCEREGLPTGSIIKSAAENTPYGKLGTPEDVAGLVSYIVSPESKFMTGQSLNINGGMVFD